MQPTYSPEAEAYREKIQAFLAEQLPADWKGIGALGLEESSAFAEDWRKIMHEHGYLAPNWPKQYGGGGLTALEQVILAPHAIKELIEPAEVAEVVAFLAGPTGRAFTGAPVTMDMGWTAR